MSLFNFFKPRAKPIQEAVQVPPGNPECDINKTHIIAALFTVPKSERGMQWRQEFYQQVATASFACDTPQTLTGPDGFTYFKLQTPEPDKPFESFCIRNMTKDFLLERGWGVVFNPAADETADWVFTYGDVVNLHLTGNFFTPVDDRDLQNIAFTKNVGVIKEEEQVMIAQPSESYLPRATRAALGRFLRGKGIKVPKVLLISSHSGGRIMRKLALNIPPENYPEKSELDYLMQQVGWFLPNDYILVPLSEKTALAKGFHPL